MLILSYSLTNNLFLSIKIKRYQNEKNKINPVLSISSVLRDEEFVLFLKKKFKVNDFDGYSAWSDDFFKDLKDCDKEKVICKFITF